MSSPVKFDLAWRQAIQREATRLLNAKRLEAAATAAERQAALDIRRQFWNRAMKPPAEWRANGPPEATRTGMLHGAGFRVENLVLETFPGWQTAVNLFLPEGKGPFTPILCPCGHGPKWQNDHQIPPQVLARRGFAAALFDAPGFGEQAHGCRHFTHGAQMLMVGIPSQWGFLADPIRAADYLATRADIRATDGFGATGVSGGGSTTLMLALADPRIRVIAPACCLASARGFVIEGLYTNCPEDYLPGQFTIGLDMDDVLAMAAPVPCLVLGGASDPVFTPEAAAAAMAKATPYYHDASRDLLDCFLDETGHHYTERMAHRAADWFRRHLRSPGPVAPTLGAVTLFEPAQLTCGANVAGGGMLELIRREAARLRARPRTARLPEDLTSILRIPARRHARAAWNLRPETGPWADPGYAAGAVRARGAIPLPAIEYRRATAPDTDALLLAFPEQQPHRLLRDLHAVPGIARLAAVDLRGFGQLTPAAATHDIKPWCDITRALSDLTLMTGRTPAGVQTEDALNAVDAATAGDPPARPVLVMGCGETALPTLFAGLLHPRVQRIILDGAPATLEMLAVAEHSAWSRYLCLPDALRYFDLPELAAATTKKSVLLLNPCDACRQRLDAIDARRLYATAPAVSIHVDTGPAASAPAIANWLRMTAPRPPDEAPHP